MFDQKKKQMNFEGALHVSNQLLLRPLVLSYFRPRKKNEPEEKNGNLNLNYIKLKYFSIKTHVTFVMKDLRKLPTSWHA